MQYEYIRDPLHNGIRAGRDILEIGKRCRVSKAITEILPHKQSLPDSQASENSLVIAGLLDHHAQVLPVR